MIILIDFLVSGMDGSCVNESSCGTAWTGLFFTIVILFLRYSVYTFFIFDRFLSSRYEWSGVNECFGGTD